MMRPWLMLVGCVIFVASSLGCALQTGSPGDELVGSSRSAISEGGTEGGGACTNATLTATPASPAGEGAAITLNAGSSTCSNPEYQFWMLAPGSSTYTIIQPYSSSPSFDWTSDTTPGNYILEVWVKDASSSAAYDVDALIGYTILSPGPTCTGATLTATPASPAGAGAAITLNAGSSTCSNPEYQFWMLAPGSSTYTIIQPYSSSPSFNWTSDTTPGNYILEVWVKDASSSGAYDVDALIGYTILSPGPTCTGATLTATPASPADTGTAIALNASSSTCSNPEYQFWMLAPGSSTYTIIQPYSSSPSFNWTSDTTPGNYILEVWVKDASSLAAYDSDSVLGYTITSTGQEACSNATLTATPASPEATGTAITLNAGSSTCSNPQYQFWMLAPGSSTYTIIQPYSSSPSFNWTSDTTPGMYILEVWVKDASSAASYDTDAVIGYTITVPVAAGEYHTCAIVPGGTVACWGANVDGQLGDGTTSGPDTCAGDPCSTAPVAVSNMTGATSVTAGADHSCALLASGSVECWGFNGEGQLGNGTTTSASTPVAVPGLTGITAISAGYLHTCALLSGGTVECWGDNEQGELGNGTTTNSSTPVAVSNLSGVAAIAAGNDVTCALLSGGTVECWGYNGYGQLGNGTTTNSPTPVAVSGLTGVTAISAGGDQVCALLTGGTVDCWGFNGSGALGNGTTTNSSTPVAVSSLTGVTAISAGFDQTCALLSGGTVECWGDNEEGDLGNGTTTSSSIPVVVSSLTGASAISAGYLHACAMLANGTVDCWGRNGEGELGNGSSTGPATCDGAPCSTTPVATSGL
jgi:alpha-tubulin suppressor-like RCC1 family protein